MSLDNRFDDRRLMPESRLIPAQVDFSRDYDADTIHVTTSSQYAKYLQGRSSVRLLGIDAPETTHRPGELNQPYGSESKQILRQIIPTSNQIYLRLPGNVSKTRVLGEVFVKDEKGNFTSVNQELIKREAAYIYEKDEYKDPLISTPEIEKEYYSKIKKYIDSPPKKGLFSKDALMPDDYRHKNLNQPFDRLLYNFGLKGSIPTALSRVKNKIISENIKEYGINNKQLTPFFNPDSQVKFIIPSQYGASYFYERAIYAANRERAGLSAFNITETQGPATSAYLFSYMNKNAGQLPKVVPWYVSNYDREMATPGLSYYINKEAIKYGWGRIYQEEKGPLASLAGAIGKVLDNSLIYYGNATPDYIRRQQEIDPTGSYIEPPAGFFQSTLSFATNFAVQTTQSVLTYFLLGVPFSIVTAEMFKTSYQGLVDIALGQGIGDVTNKKFFSHPLFQKLATGVVIGWDQFDKNPEQLKAHLWKNVTAKSSKDVKDIYNPGFNSIISGINLMQNQKAAIYFDYTIRPFIENIINPYNPRSNDTYKRFQSALDNFKSLATANIYGSFDSADPKTAKFVLQNDGFEKHKKIAEALDTLGSYLPANPAKWGLLGKNYDQVNITFDNADRIVTKNFLAFNEVFNFQELLHNLERIYYGGEFLTIVNKGTYIDETGSPIGNVIAKGKSAMAVPKSLLGKAANMIGVGIQRILNLDGLNPIIQAHHKLRDLEIELYKKNLDWDDTSKTRVLTVGDDITSKSNLDKFLQSVLDYEETLAKSNNKLKITRDFMMDKAVDNYAEHKFAQTKIRNPFELITNNKFLNNRNRFGLLALGALSFHFILDDMMKATNGASLMSQFIMALHHRETGVTPDFAQTSIFGTGVAGSAAWSGFSIAAGYGIATVGQFLSPNIDRYKLTSEAFEYINSGFKVKPSQETILKEVLKGKILTNVRPKGNFLPWMAWSTLALLAARPMSQWAVSSGLRFVQGIPFIGEALLGKGNQKVNNNLSLVAQLTAIRKEIMDRSKTQKISSYEALGAAQLGMMIAAIPIVDPKVQAKDTRVTANQAPLPYFQFFDAASTKNRMYDSQGKLIRSGELSWKIGLQTAPILGTNISFANPFVIDFDSKNALGFKGVLRYSEENDNIINHVSALGKITFNAGLFTTSMLGTFHLMELTTKMWGVRQFNTKGEISNEIKDAVSFTKNSFKWVYGAADVMLSLPSAALNKVRAEYEFTKTIWGASRDVGLGAINSLDEITILDKDAKEVFSKLNKTDKKRALELINIIQRGKIEDIQIDLEDLQDSDLPPKMGRGTNSPIKEYRISSSSEKLLVTFDYEVPITTDSGKIINREFSRQFYLDDFNYHYPHKVKKGYLGKLAKSAGIGFVLGTIAGAGAKFLGADSNTELATSASVGVLSTIGLATASQHISKLSPIGDALKSVPSNLPKIPYLKNKSSSYLLMIGAALTASWLATDSTFGIAVNMDKQNKNLEETDWAKKLTTVGILTGLAIPVLEFADIGKSPVQILTEYERGLDYLSKPKNYFNPVNLVRQPLVTYKNYVHKLYLDKVLEFTTKYRNTSGVSFINESDLANGLNKTEIINKVKTGNIKVTSDVMADKSLTTGLKALWAKPDFVSILKQPRLALKIGTLALGWAALKTTAQNIITGYGATQGRSGQSAVEAFYDAVTIDPIANAFKLITEYDKKTYNTVLDSTEYTDSTGRTFRKVGLNLLNPTDPNQQTLNKLFQNVIAPYTINPQNSYQSILPGVGVTIREGDFGVRYSYYFQTQSPLQDTSFSMFSNLASYSFALSLQGNNQYNFLIEEGLKKARARVGNNPQLLARHSVLAALGASAEMAPLKKPRKVSAPYNESTLKMISGNRIISLALSLRVRRTTELSYSRIESIRSRMIDRNDPSILSTYSNVVDIRDPLAALNSDNITKDQLALMGPEKLMRTLMAIFDTNNRISLTNYTFTKTKDKPLSVSSQTIDEPGEILAAGGNLSLDANNLDERPWWGIFGNILGLAADKLEGVPEPIKWGVYGAVGVGSLFVGLGYFGTLAYAPQDTRLNEAVNRLYTMFDPDVDGNIYNFKVTNRVVANGKGGESLQIQGKNGKQFWVAIPEGTPRDIAKEAITRSIQTVQLTINKENKAIFDNINILINTDLLDDANTPEATGKWMGKDRNIFIPGLYDQVTKLVDSYVNNIIDSYTSAGLTKLHSGLESEAIKDTKKKLKDEIYSLVNSTLEEEISNGSRLGKLGDELLSKFKGVRGQKAADTLAKKIYLTLNTFASRLDSNLLYLQSEDALGYGWRIHNAIIDMAEPLGGFFNGDKNIFTRNKQFSSTRTTPIPLEVEGDPNAKVSQEIIDNLNSIQRPRIRRRVVFGEGVAQTINIGGKIMTGFDSLDIFTAYNRLAAYKSDPYRTEGEVNFAARGAGMVTANNIISMAISELILKRLQQGAMTYMKQKPGKGALWIGIAITTAVVLYAGWKAVSEQYNRLTNWIGQSDFYKSTTSMLGSAYDFITSGIGKGLLSIDDFLSKTTGANPGTAISMIGGALTLGIGAFALGMSAPVVAALSVGGALAGAAMSAFPAIGQTANNFLTPVMDWFSQIPVIGGLLASHSSQPIIFTKFGYKDDAPIYVATAEQAIAYDSAKSLEASNDWTGKRTASLFSNKSFSGNGYRSDEPSALVFGKPTINMISSLIDREASIRGQYYNQAVIGRIIWGKMIKSSPNYKELKAFTNIQSKGNPVVGQKNRAAEAQLTSDINKLKANSISRLKGGEANQLLTATILAIAKNNTNAIEKPDANMKKSVLVNSKDVTNTHLQSQIDQIVAAIQIQPVLIKSVKGEMVNVNGTKVVISKEVGETNLQQLSITRGLVNNYNVMPGYS